MKNKDQYIIQLLPIGEREHIRVDFCSSDSSNELLKFLRLDKYRTYQLILAENSHVMSTSELDSQKIRYDLLPRKRKTWFGLRNIIVKDLLIHPQNCFYYPHKFGNYLFLNTTEAISTSEINNWLNDQFKNRHHELSDMYAGYNKNPICLLNSNDYLIIRSHDYQTHFGIIAHKNIIKDILDKLRESNLDDYEEQSYQKN
jgi:hypothetical protein